MSKKEKIIERIKNNPKDFTYGELKTLLNYLNFVEYNKGKTSGSRVAFINKNNNLIIRLHKPHANNLLKEYQIKEIIEVLKKGGMI